MKLYKVTDSTPLFLPLDPICTRVSFKHLAFRWNPTKAHIVYQLLFLADRPHQFVSFISSPPLRVPRLCLLTSYSSSSMADCFWTFTLASSEGSSWETERRRNVRTERHALTATRRQGKQIKERTRWREERQRRGGALPLGDGICGEKNLNKVVNVRRGIIKLV